MQIDINTPAVLIVAVATGLAWLLPWIGGIKEHKSSVTKFMSEIREDIKTILRRLPAEPITPKSPLALTGYGEEIAAAVGALRWAMEHVESVRDRVVGKPAYEVEEISFAYAREEYELSSSMREVMYENGYSGEHVRAVLGVVLRDELIALQDHRGSTSQKPAR